jgi:hypothetical protein
MRNDRSVTFEITATNMNLADSTDQTLVTFPDDGVIRVPDRIELKREAGTAYTIDIGAYPKSRLVDGDAPDSYEEGFGGGMFLKVYEGVVGAGGGRTWFLVDTEGFLDVATEQNRIAFPKLSAKSWNENVTSLKLRLSGSVSGGTGSLKGTVFFKEYGITGPMGR